MTSSFCSWAQRPRRRLPEPQNFPNTKKKKSTSLCKPSLHPSQLLIWLGERQPRVGLPSSSRSLPVALRNHAFHFKEAIFHKITSVTDSRPWGPCTGGSFCQADRAPKSLRASGDACERILKTRASHMRRGSPSRKWDRSVFCVALENRLTGSRCVHLGCELLRDPVSCALLCQPPVPTRRVTTELRGHSWNKGDNEGGRQRCLRS